MTENLVLYCEAWVNPFGVIKVGSLQVVPIEHDGDGVTVLVSYSAPELGRLHISVFWKNMGLEQVAEISRNAGKLQSFNQKIARAIEKLLERQDE